MTIFLNDTQKRTKISVILGYLDICRILTAVSTNWHYDSTLKLSTLYFPWYFHSLICRRSSFIYKQKMLVIDGITDLIMMLQSGDTLRDVPNIFELHVP